MTISWFTKNEGPAESFHICLIDYGTCYRNFRYAGNWLLMTKCIRPVIKTLKILIRLSSRDFDEASSQGENHVASEITCANNLDCKDDINFVIRVFLHLKNVCWSHWLLQLFFLRSEIHHRNVSLLQIFWNMSQMWTINTS